MRIVFSRGIFWLIFSNFFNFAKCRIAPQNGIWSPELRPPWHGPSRRSVVTVAARARSRRRILAVRWPPSRAEDRRSRADGGTSRGNRGLLSHPGADPHRESGLRYVEDRTAADRGTSRGNRGLLSHPGADPHTDILSRRMEEPGTAASGGTSRGNRGLLSHPGADPYKESRIHHTEDTGAMAGEDTSRGGRRPLERPDEDPHQGTIHPAKMVLWRMTGCGGTRDQPPTNSPHTPTTAASGTDGPHRWITTNPFPPWSNRIRAGPRARRPPREAHLLGRSPRAPPPPPRGFRRPRHTVRSRSDCTTPGTPPHEMPTIHRTQTPPDETQTPHRRPGAVTARTTYQVGLEIEIV